MHTVHSEFYNYNFLKLIFRHTSHRQSIVQLRWYSEITFNFLLFKTLTTKSAKRQFSLKAQTKTKQKTVKQTNLIASFLSTVMPSYVSHNKNSPIYHFYYFFPFLPLLPFLLNRISSATIFLNRVRGCKLWSETSRVQIRFQKS